MADANKNCCVMFPNSSTSVMLGQSLVSDLCNVSYFIPEGTHEQAASTCYEEVLLNSSVASNRGGVSVKKIRDYKELINYDYIVFPNLDVNPRKTRKEYGNMCHNLFKYEHFLH